MSNNSSHSNIERLISMPNELLSDLRLWLTQKELKSAHHQEFIYSYYFLIAYLWRYAEYASSKINQQEIKKRLGYNPNDKSLNYLIKQGGLLDAKGYTLASRDYPISWEFKNKEDGVSFTMYSDFSDDYKKLITKFVSANYIVKAPLVSIGTEESDGLYWNPSDSHFISKDVFDLCMQDSDLGCAGFFVFGILKYIEDKSKHFNDSSSFECGNDTLVSLTGSGERRIIRLTTRLSEVGLIKKEQQVKRKGQRNVYRLLV